MRLTHFTALAVCAALVSPLGAQCVISDFESFTAPTVNGTILFRQPGFSGSTSGFLNIVAGAPFNHTRVIAGEQNHTSGGNQSMKVEFEFLPEAAATRWVRLTTFNTPTLPNPELDYTKKFRIWVYVPTNTPDFYLSLGTRETGSAAGCGGNGGTLNGIEWIGATSSTGSNAPIGKLVNLKDQWVEVVFDFQNDPVRGFAGLTANSILEGSTGTLEHLAITPVDPTANVPFIFYLDDPEVMGEESLPGDVNGDGCVNDEDLLLVLFAFGNLGGPEDLDGSGFVDDGDLLIVLFNFGTGCEAE
ncbi:MAG: hypothetical protein KIT45_14870 [Fimbriimonadia bacterium]|nr:hypothetical protein [Fimbriimonadia bacterium]